MEEKKISLLTFLLIFALIVIIAMGIFTYKLYNEKIESTKEADNLKIQVNSLTQTVNNLQGKIDNISATINSNNSTNTVNTNSTPFSEEQVKTTLSNYLELRAHLNCNALIENLTKKGVLNYDYSKNVDSNDGRYITNVKYSEYRNAMLKYVSKNEFERNWDSYYSEDSNGNLIQPNGGGGLAVYTIKGITKINDSTYSAKTTSVVDDTDFFKEDNFTFVLKSYDGNCVIDSIK